MGSGPIKPDLVSLHQIESWDQTAHISGNDDDGSCELVPGRCVKNLD